jgi:hypothetical protein
MTLPEYEIPKGKNNLRTGGGTDHSTTRKYIFIVEIQRVRSTIYPFCDKIDLSGLVTSYS